MSNLYIFLAEGYEEIEALTVVDLLRRANIDIEMVSITGEKMVRGAHGINVEADVLYEEIKAEEADMLVLPGGMPGTKNLMAQEDLVSNLKQFHEAGKAVAAICAAPMVLGENGILEGKKAVCYPGFEANLKGATVLKEEAVTDGNVITSRGLGTAIEFAGEIITYFLDAKKAPLLGEYNKDGLHTSIYFFYI